MTARVIDFDAFRAEQAAKNGTGEEHPTIIVGGRVYDLPPDLPATIAVEVIRLQKTEGAQANVDPQMLLDIGNALFGESTFREILDAERMGVKDMGSLITQAFKAYDPSEGKDAAPNRATRRRSKRST